MWTKMWTTLSAGRWICLLTLAVVMLFSASEVDSYNPINLPCCHKTNSRTVGIKACYEQKPRDACNFHAFLVKDQRGKLWCISPSAKWLTDKIVKGKLACPPVLSLNGDKNATA